MPTIPALSPRRSPPPTRRSTRSASRAADRRGWSSSPTPSRARWRRIGAGPRAQRARTWTGIARSPPRSPGRSSARRGTDYVHDLAYCSRSGPPSQPWLEPDVNDHLRKLDADGVGAVVVVPIGFVSDHMEVIFDLDTEAAATAAELGLRFAPRGDRRRPPRLRQWAGRPDARAGRRRARRASRAAGGRRRCRRLVRVPAGLLPEPARPRSRRPLPGRRPPDRPPSDRRARSDPLSGWPKLRRPRREFCRPAAL